MQLIHPAPFGLPNRSRPSVNIQAMQNDPGKSPSPSQREANNQSHSLIISQPRSHRSEESYAAHARSLPSIHLEDRARKRTCQIDSALSVTAVKRDHHSNSPVALWNTYLKWVSITSLSGYVNRGSLTLFPPYSKSHLLGCTSTCSSRVLLYHKYKP